MADHTGFETDIDRRSVLRTVALAGLGGTTMGTVSAKASETPDQSNVYEVSVWLTDDLVTWSREEYGDGWRAHTRAKTYIEAAFDRSHVPHSVAVKTPQTPVPFRGGSVFEEYVGQAVCGDGTKRYSHPLEYFNEWLTADCTSVSPAAHSNVLLIGEGGGGLSYVGGIAGTYAGARRIARLPAAYQPYASKPYGDRLGMSGMLHEIGHNLITADPTHHELASFHARSQGEMKTVMGVSGSENYCGEATTAEEDGRELTYSACALEHFKS